MGDWLVGIALILLPVGAAGLIVYLVLGKMRREGLDAVARRDAFRQREQRAVWAGATVVSVQRSAVIDPGSSRARADLRLKVQPPGGEAYLAQARWMVDLAVLAQIQPGAQLSVKIDAEDPQVIYPNLSGAEICVV